MQKSNEQLRAAIIASMLKSNLNVDANAYEDEAGEWCIKVVGPIPEDYSLSDKVAGIKIIKDVVDTKHG